MNKLTITRTADKIHKAYFGKPPEPPPPKDCLQDNFYDLCCFYRDTPNLYAAMRANGWKDCPEAKLMEYAAIMRRRPIIGPYLDRVDQFYYKLQQNRQQSKQLEQMTSDLYSSLPVTTLTDEEKDFVYHYAGDIKEALRAIGVSPTRRNKLLLLKNPVVQECKTLIDAFIFSGNIVRTSEALSMLSDMARNESYKPSDRLAALKPLLQQQGELAEKIIIDKYVREDKLEINIQDAGTIDVVPRSKLVK